MTRTVYANGRIFTADEPAWAESIVIDGERIVFVGSDAEAAAAARARMPRSSTSAAGSCCPASSTPTRTS